MSTMFYGFTELVNTKLKLDFPAAVEEYSRVYDILNTGVSSVPHPVRIDGRIRLVPEVTLSIKEWVKYFKGESFLKICFKDGMEVPKEELFTERFYDNVTFCIDHARRLRNLQNSLNQLQEQHNVWLDSDYVIYAG